MLRPRHTPVIASLLILLASCGTTARDDADTPRPDGWSDSTHGKDAAPNYDLVFDIDRVHTMTLTMTPEDFATMQSDLAEIFGQSASEPGQMRGGGRGQGGGGNLDFTNGRDPVYVPVTVDYDGEVWTHVGMRYKGNSSLQTGFSTGNGKLPFRLNFDYWEDDFPLIDDQRFHGFDKITFASGHLDDSNLRDTLAAEVFRAHGIPSARTAYYRILVDVGEGPVYWGLYTMIEDPSDDPMIERVFGDSSGNVYKPDGTGADWQVFDAEGFGKKTNEDEADYSDAQACVAALHADASDREAWRAGLEVHFDVDSFLRWLAVNTVIQNWDAYGALAHNYYLHADPARGDVLVWVPWDHNESFKTPNRGRGDTTGTPLEQIMHASVGDEWPLISMLLDDPVYSARYMSFVEQALEGPFSIDAFSTRATELHELIAPHMVGEGGELDSHTLLTSPAAFESSVDDLVSHVRSRHELVNAALEANE